MSDTMKRYTGGGRVYEGLSTKPSKPTLAAMLAWQTSAADLGVKYTAKAVTEAFKAAHDGHAKAVEVRTAAKAHPATQAEQAEQVAADYRAGKASAEDMVHAVAVAASLSTSPVAKELGSRVEALARADEARGLAALGAITEAQWVAPLARAVAARVAEVNALADRIGIKGPRAATPGVRSLDHAWAPTARDLSLSMDLRHNWEKFGAALDDLQDVFTLADSLRLYGYLPIVSGRDTLEDYRWLNLKRLSGTPSMRREFWLANRMHGEPGLFTAEQMLAADTGRDTTRNEQSEDEREDEPVSA